MTGTAFSPSRTTKPEFRVIFIIMGLLASTQATYPSFQAGMRAGCRRFAPTLQRQFSTHNLPTETCARGSQNQKHRLRTILVPATVAVLFMASHRETAQCKHPYHEPPQKEVPKREAMKVVVQRLLNNAVMSGDLTRVKELTQYRELDLGHALYLANKAQKPDIAKHLIASKAPITDTLLQTIIDGVADPAIQEYVIREYPAYQTDDLGSKYKQALETILKNGARKGDFKLVKQLCQYEDINLDEALFTAACNKRQVIADYLLKKGASTKRVRAWYERLPITVLSDSILTRMLEEEPNLVNKKDCDGQTPLHIAVSNNLYSWVSILIRKKADVDATNNLGETPLHCAASNGNRPIIEALIAAEGNVNARNISKKTPMHYAAQAKNTEIIKLLLEKGGAVDSIDESGWYPLRYALHPETVKTDWNGEEAAKLLIAASKNINAKITDNDETALHIAAWYKHETFVEWLIAQGADVNAKTKDGLTPLMMAVQRNHTSLVKLLLKNSEIDLTSQCRKDRGIWKVDWCDMMALDIAREIAKNPEMVKLIEEAMIRAYKKERECSECHRPMDPEGIE